MTLDHCAEALRDHDPDRFGICLLAPPAARARLLTLYALNLELARAPLAANEPMLAEMRLQWWVDELRAIGTGRVSSHELLAPLAEAWGPRAAAFATLAEGRRRDADREPHADAAAVIDYVGATAVPLTLFAAEALDMPLDAAGAVAAQAEGVGLTNWLAAVPALQSVGLGLTSADPAPLAAIAQAAQDALRRAAKRRRMVPRRIAPVLKPRTGTLDLLSRVAKGGGMAAINASNASEFRRRLGFGLFALHGRWWLMPRR